MMEPLLFMCLLLSALLLCLTMEAVPLWCLLLLTTVLLQIYKTLTQQIDANRCVNMMVRKAYLYIHIRCIHVWNVGMPERRCMIVCIHGTKNEVVVGKCIHGTKNEVVVGKCIHGTINDIVGKCIHDYVVQNIMWQYVHIWNVYRTLWGERELCGLYVLHRQHNS